MSSQKRMEVDTQPFSESDFLAPFKMSLSPPHSLIPHSLESLGSIDVLMRTASMIQ